MSKKSSPGDGSHSKGTKGGGVYGAHIAVADTTVAASGVRLLRSLAGLRRIVGASRA